MWWSVFALLSSSCCAVQLILNIFSFGCAGFNTYLGPLRPIFLSMTVALQARVWEAAIRDVNLPTTPPYFLLTCAASSAFTATLALLPEIVDILNRMRVQRLQQQASQTLAESKVVERTIASVQLEGLGCVACVNTIQRALQEAVGEFSKEVISWEVSLEKTEARFELSCERSVAEERVLPVLMSKIEGCGFEASVKSIRSDS